MKTLAHHFRFGHLSVTRLSIENVSICSQTAVVALYQPLLRQKSACSEHLFLRLRWLIEINEMF